ncbi:MAG: hypothetical protein U1F49_20220 [Rubrivivax sp.]
MHAALTFTQPSRTRKAALFGLSALIATAFLTPFLGTQHHARPRPALESQLVFVALPPPRSTPPPRARSTSAPRRAVIAPGTTRQVERTEPPAPERAGVEPAAPASVAVIAEPAPQRPNDVASAPLRLDASVLRRAAIDSKSEVRALAEASGTYVGDAPLSGQERLAQGVARTGKPDCLRQGGSLLDVFVIAFQAFGDKCK